jgi:PleD family two-component response regulator
MIHMVIIVAMRFCVEWRRAAQTDAREIEIIVTASIGVATSSINEENSMDDVVTLIRKADRAMYNGAKQQGRDKVASFSEMKRIPHF